LYLKKRERKNEIKKSNRERGGDRERELTEYGAATHRLLLQKEYII